MIISYQALEQWEAAEGPGQLLHKVIYSRPSKTLSFYVTVRGCCRRSLSVTEAELEAGALFAAERWDAGRALQARVV